MNEHPTDDLTTVPTGRTAPGGWSIPAPRTPAGYGADRALAARLHELADHVALRGRPGPTRVDGLPRVLVVPEAVHDLLCRVRVRTRQGTVPDVSHCAACGLAVPVDGPADGGDQAGTGGWAVPLGPDTGDDPGMDERTVRLLLSAGAAIEREVTAERLAAVAESIDEPSLGHDILEMFAAMPGDPAAVRTAFDAAYELGHDDGTAGGKTLDHAAAAYRAGRLAGYAARLRDEHGVPDPTRPGEDCPEWCTRHDDTFGANYHMSATALPEGLGDHLAVWTNRVDDTDGGTDTGLWIGEDDITAAQARGLAAALLTAADRAEQSAGR